MAGLACYLAKSTKVDAFPNVQATLADLLMFVELQRALVAQALATAVPTPFGTYAPNRWPLHTAQLHFYERYDRMINAVRTLGAGGLVAAPSYAELGGEIGDVVERYFASATLDSEKRIRLLRLAADASISSFSGRQSLYERYYQGDPVRRVSAYYADYAAAPLVDRIETLLADFAEHPPVIPGHVTQRSPK
jgi:4-hydroxyphenylacetate 3-monooxygenase